MEVSDYDAVFSEMLSLFLEQDKHKSHLDFKLFDQKKNMIIPKKFYLQLTNKVMGIYDITEAKQNLF